MITFDQENSSEDLLDEELISEAGKLGDTVNKADTFFSTKLDGVNDLLDKVTNKGISIKDSSGEEVASTGGVKKASQKLQEIDSKLRSATTPRPSLIARARNSVLQFPIYISSSTNVNVAHTISKSFERVYATLVQTVLSQNPIQNEEELNNLAFLKNYHTNINESVNALYNEYYEPIDDFDRMMVEAVSNVLPVSKNVSVAFNKIPSNNQYLNTENARLLYDPLTGFEGFLQEASLDSKGVEKKETKSDTNTEKENDKVMRLNEDDLKKYFTAEKEPEPPARRDYKDPTEFSKAQNKYNDAKQKYANAFDKFVDEIKNGKKVSSEYGTEIKWDDDEGSFVTRSRGKGTITRTTSSTTTSNTPVEIKAPQLLRDSEIKKINDMLPYTIDANFMISKTEKDSEGKPVKDKNGNKSTSISGNVVHYIVGIKSVLHIIQPKDLGSEVKDLIMGDMKSLQKVRHKTGEISFWKDYIFKIKSLKSDASKNLDSGKRWINTLKRLSEYNNMYGTVLDKGISAVTGGSIPIPNGTLVLMQPDVISIKNTSGIDLSSVGMAKRLAKNLFLISVVIVDATAGSMKVLFPDSDNDWDVQSLASLDSEVAKDTNSNIAKEINRIINK